MQHFRLEALEEAFLHLITSNFKGLALRLSREENQNL